MIRLFIRTNDTRGLPVLATAPCKVILSDAEDAHTHEVDAKVVSEAEIIIAHQDALNADVVDPKFVADWIYDQDLDGDMLRDLFRKRGCRTAVIDAEDSCGDDTCEFFLNQVALEDECITTTSDGWRIFRNRAEMEAYDLDQAAADEPQKSQP